MPFVYQEDIYNFAGTIYLAPNERILVAPGVTLAQPGNTGFPLLGGSASGQSIQVSGNLWSAAARTLEFLGDNSAVVVTGTGLVSNLSSSNSAVVSPGRNALVTNMGTISGWGGVAVASRDGAVSTVTNHGTIAAIGTVTAGAEFPVAISVNVIGASLTRIVSTGTLIGGTLGGGDQSIAIRLSGDLTLEARLNLSNIGTITGDILLGLGADRILNAGTVNGAILTGGNSDVVTNTGAVNGLMALGGEADFVFNRGIIADNVELGPGADGYDGRGGVVLGTILGGDGDDTISGGESDDLIEGGTGNDLLQGGTGDDRIDGGDGNDNILGGAGDDLLTGGIGSDTIRGGAGDDTITGASGKDSLSGGAGDDVLDGGSGNDRLSGGRGDDTLTGGTGRDTFIFRPGDGDDRVTDFVDTQDRANVGAFDFTGFADMLTEATLSSVAGGVRIDFDTGDSLTLNGVALANLTAADFVF